MELHLGPFTFRHYSGASWSSLEIAVATNPRCGLARRETAIRCSLRSEHLIDWMGIPNPADTFQAPDGSITHGRMVLHGGHAYAISAQQVYASELLERSRIAAREQTNVDGAATTMSVFPSVQEPSSAS